MSSYVSQQLKKKPPFSVFLAATIVVFFCSLSAADSIGFVPSYIDGSTPIASDDVSTDMTLTELPQLGDTSTPTPSTGSGQATTTLVAPIALPDRLIIPAIDLDLPIQNPSTRDVNALDTLLQKGPARYVDSARLGEAGNVVIFAHSSHLPVVHNQMYRAFNKIPDLKAGDTITLQGNGHSYLYTVTSVSKVDVEDGTISLSPSQGTKLTLVTCDTLTGKSARYVLSADFVGTVN